LLHVHLVPALSSKFHLSEVKHGETNLSVACRFLLLSLLLAVAPALAVDKPAPAAAPAAKPRQLSLDNKPRTGDFDRMLERRQIRILIPYSRTLFYIDKGHERGVTAELARDFERFVNKKYAKQLGKRPLTVYLIPTTRDKLLPNVAEGLGDIAAGNITITEERRKIIDFVAEGARPVQELIVTGPKSPQLATLEDLSGKTIHVRKTTSYHESVLALNERLKQARKDPVKIVLLPDALEDEDKLEMLNAGLFEFVIVDDWMARLWAQALPKIKVREDLVLRKGAQIGVAMRKGNSHLAGEFADFYAGFLKTQGGLDARRAQYFKRVKQIKDSSGGEEMKRFGQTVQLFEKYGAQYGFDPLMLAAQGFQESQLRQDAKSHVGAIGVMQLMPTTGKELGVGDIGQIEPNIHAGAKYMDKLMTQYFADAKFSEQDRTLFAFASYNCGPGNVSKMRKEAAKRGLDPDKWFNNVEIVVGEKIGMETTGYVRNIFKYYVAYKLGTAAQAAARTAREQIEPSKK
jgi:membrane-bound lytic murein transglycosylase MltF